MSQELIFNILIQAIALVIAFFTILSKLEDKMDEINEKQNDRISKIEREQIRMESAINSGSNHLNAMETLLLDNIKSSSEKIVEIGKSNSNKLDRIYSKVRDCTK